MIQSEFQRYSFKIAVEVNKKQIQKKFSNPLNLDKNLFQLLDPSFSQELARDVGPNFSLGELSFRKNKINVLKKYPF